MKIPKTDQLRIRQTSQQREALERELKRRGKNQTLSDLVRELIDEGISPDANQVSCRVPRAVYDRVEALGRMLNRSTQQVIVQCLENICDVAEQPDKSQVPLVVAECQLRREYQQKQRGGFECSPEGEVFKADSN